MEHGYDHEASQYLVVDWTPEIDGDYSVFVESDGDSMIAIREQGTGVILAADDDILTGPNSSDGAIAAVSLTGGVNYEVIVGQFTGNAEVTTAQVFAKEIGSPDVVPIASHPTVHFALVTRMKLSLKLQIPMRGLPSFRKANIVAIQDISLGNAVALGSDTHPAHNFVDEYSLSPEAQVLCPPTTLM